MVEPLGKIRFDVDDAPSSGLGNLAAISMWPSIKSMWRQSNRCNSCGRIPAKSATHDMAEGQRRSLFSAARINPSASSGVSVTTSPLRTVSKSSLAIGFVSTHPRFTPKLKTARRLRRRRCGPPVSCRPFRHQYRRGRCRTRCDHAARRSAAACTSARVRYAAERFFFDSVNRSNKVLNVTLFARIRGAQ